MLSLATVHCSLHSLVAVQEREYVLVLALSTAVVVLLRYTLCSLHSCVDSRESTTVQTR